MDTLHACLPVFGSSSSSHEWNVISHLIYSKEIREIRQLNAYDPKSDISTLAEKFSRLPTRLHEVPHSPSPLSSILPKQNAPWRDNSR